LKTLCRSNGAVHSDGYSHDVLVICFMEICVLRC